LNILFHLTLGTSIIASLTHSEIKSKKDLIQKTVIGGGIGILSHGVLDYTPHCYPIHSKFDAIFGFILILFTLWHVKRKWRIISLFTLLGCILPDLIDLSPGILNSLLPLNLPTFDPIFPWHIHTYSGSIYTNDCSVSTLNHLLVLLFSGVVIWYHKNTLKTIINNDRS